MAWYTMVCITGCHDTLWCVHTGRHAIHNVSFKQKYTDHILLWISLLWINDGKCWPHGRNAVQCHTFTYRILFYSEVPGTASVIMPPSHLFFPACLQKWATAENMPALDRENRSWWLKRHKGITRMWCHRLLGIVALTLLMVSCHQSTGPKAGT